MKYRYLRDWTEHGLGRAVTSVIGWQHAVPRVGDLYPGLTTPIPKIGAVLPDLSFCIEEQANRLAKLDRPMVVLWSGGLDSSIALVALANAERTQPLMYTTNKQAFESASPALQDAINKLDATSIEYSFEAIQKLKSEGWLFVTGTHADSITLGEMADANHIHESIWDMSSTELLTAHNNTSNGGNRIKLKNTLRFWEQLEPLFELMPFEQTVVNRAWWLDFTCCWSRDEYDMVFRLDLTEGPEKDYVNFFGSESFQQWAMQDVRDKALGRDPKGRLRKWINDTLGIDSACVKNLMKEELISPTYEQIIGSSRLVAIDENYKAHMAAY